VTADVAFGITAAPRTDHARLGGEIERLGYDELWVNDTRRGDGLATLAEIAPGTAALRFGVGVVALSEQEPAAIAARLRTAALPAGRLTLGVGSGASSSLDLVRLGVAELRNLLPDVPIAVAAVGPRMAHLAGEIADAVVANWALPNRLAEVRAHIAEGAAVIGRPPPRLVGYVRVAVGPGAEERLAREMDRYRSFGRHYARAFAAQPAGPVGIAASDPASVRAALDPYRGVVDTLVVRGLPAVGGWLEVARAAAFSGAS
jgi:alkanesulfonate monooxygenase SsuD/methylene tetrahydromethanopterin reductase-like flavin-dependent oxidoreductase (luciferase family)